MPRASGSGKKISNRGPLALPLLQLGFTYIFLTIKSVIHLHFKGLPDCTKGKICQFFQRVKIPQLLYILLKYFEGFLYLLEMDNIQQIADAVLKDL